jgi:hypothetical protein
MRLYMSVKGGGISWRSPVIAHCDTFRTLVG